MKNCFPDTVKVGDETVDITKITSGENFGLDKENYTDVAGIVLGDGTPMILSWNKNCPVSDPDVVASKGNSNQSASLTYSCVKGFYDLNGFRGPNRISNNIKRLDDVIGFNGTSALSETHAMPCLFELSNGKCLTAPPNEYTSMSESDCMAQKSTLGLSYCNDNDYYAGAARACGGRDKIASASDLEQLGKEIYGNNFTFGAPVSVSNDVIHSIAVKYEVYDDTSDSGFLYFFTNVDNNDDWVGDVMFSTSAANSTTTGRSVSQDTNNVICVGDK
ncbi:hypothetical protein J6G99_06525 [bacterium]|nr:hypothetical protein [bacterium]